MRSLVPQEKTFSDLNPRQLCFLNLYIETGNATKAYIQAYRIKNPASASVLASRLLKQVKEITVGLYEKHGLDEMTFIRTLKGALRAKRQQVSQAKVYEFPDHYARMKALELLHKFTNREDEKEGENVNQLNVVMISDKKRHIVKVIEADDEGVAELKAQYPNSITTTRL